MFFLSGRAYTDATYTAALMNGAKLYTYETGTTTNKTTYSDGNESSANTNPIVADTDGVFGGIYASNGRFKFVLKTAAGVTVRTWDPWDAGIGYIKATSAPSDTFGGLEYHNSTDGHRYRRKSDDSGWIDLGPVDTAVNSAATVTEVLTGTETAKAVTPDGLAAIWQRGTSITPSGGTVSLPSTGGGVFTINAGNFSAISSASGGRVIIFEFAGASVITHNGTSMDLPGNANITTVAGDRAAFVNLAAQDATGSNWRCLWFTRDTGSPLNIADLISTQAQEEAASVTTAITTPGRAQYHPGVAKARAMWDASSGTPTAAGTSYNVSSLSDTGVGIVTINFTTSFSSANYHPAGISQRNATNSDAVMSVTFGTAPLSSALAVTSHTAGTATDFAYNACIIHGDQ